MEFNAHLTKHLKKLFPDFDEMLIENIFESGKQIELKAGSYLFHQGDQDNSIYIVLKGRLRAIVVNNGQTNVLGDIAAGEMVGEMAFIIEEERMASIRAIRDSVVLQFSPQQFMDFFTSDPEIATSLFKLLGKRLKQNAFDKKKSSAPKNIVFISLQASEKLLFLKSEMQKYLKEIGNPVQFYEEDSIHKKDKNSFFEKLENQEGCNILFCDEFNKNWTRECVIFADLIIVASPFEADPDILEFEKHLDLYSKDIMHKKIYLLLMHKEDYFIPQNSSRWLKERSVDLHIHIRPQKLKDIHRFCRIISHKATGLVLGGGGAKGFAHIGVVKALIETGIEIDFLGGTSAGALYGIGMAYADFDMKMIHELNAEGIKRKLTSRDLNLPIISLMTGRKFKKYLKEMFQDTGLEDIWINTFCISTNISKAVMHVHKRGPIWKQILASMAIPGVFPPVIINKNLHVDGGVMDNLPIEPIYQYAVDRIFAVSLSSFHFKEIELEEIPSSWTILKDKIIGKRKFSLPGIASLITNSMVINSYQKQEATKNKVSHYLELDLKGVKMLDDKNWEEIIQKGYDQTKAYLKNNGFNNQFD